MSTRRGPARALSSLAVLAIAGAPLACTEPPSGVHVIVTMKDADFDDAHLFDHLTLTARIADRRADACLYPADAVDRAVPLDDPSPNACADRRTQPWTGPPTAASWALEKTPRTINIDTDGPEEVEITVVGGLGGRLGTVRATGTLVASPDYPDLTLTLEAADPLFPDGCEARLEPSVPEDFEGQYELCEAPFDESSPCPAIGTSLRSPAVTCLDDEWSRVRNGPGVTCGLEKGQPVVWRTPPLPTIRSCVRLFVRGQLARCKEGNPIDDPACEKTTACTPKPVALWSRGKLADVFHTWVPFECLPPTGVPMTWSVLLGLPKEAALVGLSQSVETSDEDACFLDVDAIASTSKECPP